MDGVTPASDEAQDSIYTCTSCQAKCESSAACASWSFNSSQIAPDSVTGTCGLDVSGEALRGVEGLGSGLPDCIL